MELEAAQWFSRDEVQRAYDRTCSDPKFKVSDYLFNVTIFLRMLQKATTIDKNFYMFPQEVQSLFVLSESGWQESCDIPRSLIKYVYSIICNSSQLRQI